MKLNAVSLILFATKRLSKHFNIIYLIHNLTKYVRLNVRSTHDSVDQRDQFLFIVLSLDEMSFNERLQLS